MPTPHRKLLNAIDNIAAGHPSFLRFDEYRFKPLLEEANIVFEEIQYPKPSGPFDKSKTPRLGLKFKIITESNREAEVEIIFDYAYRLYSLSSSEIW